jgi:hypothetical protein
MGPGVSTPDAAIYTEATERLELRNVELSHLSVEVGHFYMEDLINGEDKIRAQLLRVKPCLDLAAQLTAMDLADGVKPRISTCFLIDDYFRNDTKPAAIVPKLHRIATDCGITIDYLAREAGCADADGLKLAELTAARLVPEPPSGTDGARPPLEQTGWLSNGERSAGSDSDQAMQFQPWRPAEEFGKRAHSIFLDVELWSKETDRATGQMRTKWSCPFLASIWQLLRLGMLRNHGAPIAVPEPRTVDEYWPEHWHELPTVMKLNAAAPPFAAHKIVTIMPHSYLAIEHAVDVILRHLDLDDAVTDQIMARAAGQYRDGVVLSRLVSKRISHMLIEDHSSGPHEPQAAQC